MNNISTISKVFCNFIRPIHLNNVTPLLYQAHVTRLYIIYYWVYFNTEIILIVYSKK